jgi:hypothetical protein
MVNPRNYLYLTDFQESTYAGQNAKNRAFYSGRNQERSVFTVPALSIAGLAFILRLFELFEAPPRGQDQRLCPAV